MFKNGHAKLRRYDKRNMYVCHNGHVWMALCDIQDSLIDQMRLETQKYKTQVESEVSQCDKMKLELQNITQSDVHKVR